MNRLDEYSKVSTYFYQTVSTIDLLDTGAGTDAMDGGNGNDTYLLRSGGTDRIFDSGGSFDVVQLTDVASTDITAVERRVNDLVLTYGTANQLTVSNYFSSASYRIEQFSFADGVSWDDAAIKSRTITTGTSGNDYIYGYDEAPNIMAGLDGNDTLYGGAKDDRIDGGNGNDLINTGSGADMIAFNRGDGQDTIQASTGKDNTISLGKGIAYDDLLLSKSGSDLVLATGQNERITLKNWYVNSSYHSIANLQFVTEASRNYDPASTDPLLQQKIQQFNFENIVNHFDQARSANAGLSSWALTSALLDAHLASSDLAGLGGDLTYGYGKNGNLSDVSIMAAQALMGTSQFGLAAQNLHVANALPDLSPRLM